jgi:hypothetical protein
MSELCCHLWPVRLCQIFPHYLIKDSIFGGTNYIQKICVSSQCICQPLQCNLATIIHKHWAVLLHVAAMFEHVSHVGMLANYSAVAGIVYVL